MTEIENIKAKIARFPSQEIMFTLGEVLPLITTIESQSSQIESLKAITELAVGCLELISAGNIYFPSWTDTVDILIGVRKVAKETLSEIEKLQK